MGITILLSMFRKLVFGFFIFILFVNTSYAGNFETGIKLFKATKYKQAVKQFHRAEAAGVKKTSLYYNLAVSYFKLANYKKAKKYFLITSKDAKFAQLSQYNLGLVALKQKKKKLALKRFLRASSTAGDPRITAIANKQIDKLKLGKGVQAADGGMSVTYGNDSNVLLLTDDSPSRKSDNYIESYLYGGVRLGNAYRLSGSWYQRNYSVVNSGDYSVLQVKGDYLFAIGDWKVEPGVAFSNSQFGSRDYLDTLDLNIVAKRRMDAGRVVLRYRYSDIGARDSIYNYLAGSRQQARMDYYTKTDIGRLRYRYQLELNSRENRATKNYSPTRHDFRLRLRKKLADNWKLKLDAQYRFSNYSAAAGVVRKDTRLRMVAGLGYRLNRQWTITGRVINTNNDSNLISEDYARTDWQLYTQLTF